MEAVSFPRKLAAALILIAGIAGLYASVAPNTFWALFSKDKEGAGRDAITAYLAPSAQESQKPLYVEPYGDAAAAASDNLTGLLADTLSDQLMADVGAESFLGEGSADISETLPDYSTLLENELAKVDPSRIFKAGAFDIVVINDNSREAKKKYDERVTPVVEKIFAGLNDNASSFSEKDLAQVVDNHNAAITIALATPVPNDWAEYHRKGVAYLMEEGKFFRRLAPYTTIR